MEDSNSKEVSTASPKGTGESSKKKSIGQLFGIELSAPEGMKNPMTTFTVLVVGNFLLLFFLGKALGLF